MTLGLETILPFLRPIEHLIRDDSISEIMVNGSSRVFIERAGVLEQVPSLTVSEKSLMVAVKNIAPVSETTFYSRFPTKQKLFIAVIERRMNLVFSQVSTALPIDSPIESTLKEFGSRLLQVALSKDQIALLRVLGMESRRFPELGERFYELGPKRGLTFLRHYVEEQIKRGRLIKDDPVIMAEHLRSLLVSGPVLWAVLGLRKDPGKKGRQDRIDAAVKAFLRAYSAERNP